MLNRIHIKKIALAGTLALIAFSVYLPALRNDFVYWDDDRYILENDHIRSLTADFFKWAFFDFYASNWHPLTWISHSLDYAVWGLNPAGHHLTNIILHAINTFLVAILAMNLREVWTENAKSAISPTGDNSRAVLITGGVTGILFGLHPLHVESVAWVSERKDLLCAIFFLLSLQAYIKYRRVPHKEPLPISRAFFNKQYLLSLGSCALALSSKPMAVSLPAVLLILDWHPFGRIRSLKSFWSALVEKLPFIALSAGSSLVTLYAQKNAMMLTLVPLPDRIIVAAKALIMYLVNMAWPLRLTPYYPYPREISLFSPDNLLSMLLVIGITILCILAMRQKLWLSVWSYYLVTLLPVLGIIQVGGQAMADRYTYLPSIGPFLMISVVATAIPETLIASIKGGMVAKGLRISLAVMIAVAIALSYLTVRQISIWKNSMNLWNFVIDKEAENAPLAYQNRGGALLDAGRPDQAIADLNTAIALAPQCIPCYYLRGLAFLQTDKYKEAIADFGKTLELDPQYWEAFYYREQALRKMGK